MSCAVSALSREAPPHRRERIRGERGSRTNAQRGVRLRLSYTTDRKSAALTAAVADIGTTTIEVQEV
ncbi:hypothetical protein IJG04_02880, partial [Candidatus Saccharibacteria bacterium]|nr:hypothetical protein [Candidatus Saccharibacteria bacterium]